MDNDDGEQSQYITSVEELFPPERAADAVFPPEKTETVVLDSICEESREVLDHRINLLQKTDEKVARTVRTAVLVLSISISAVGIGGLDSVTGRTAVFAGMGLVGLFLTVVYGIVVYSDSKTTVGPDERFRLEPRREPFSEREWLVLLAIGYDEWVA